MLVTELEKMALVGQLEVLRKEYESEHITYPELWQSSYDISKMLGISRYKALFIIKHCLANGSIVSREIQHRPNVMKTQYMVTQQGTSRVNWFIETERYQHSVNWILRNHNELRRAKLAKQIKRHQAIFGKNSTFKDVKNLGE